MRVAGATLDARYEALLAYTGFLKQGFARINVMASGVARGLNTSNRPDQVADVRFVRLQLWR
jgi:hypothetical protein